MVKVKYEGASDNEYYFISYRCTSQYDMTVIYGNDVINTHPVLWLKEQRLKHPSENIQLEFYNEITKRIFDEADGWIE